MCQGALTSRGHAPKLPSMPVPSPAQDAHPTRGRSAATPPVELQLQPHTSPHPPNSQANLGSPRARQSSDAREPFSISSSIHTPAAARCSSRPLAPAPYTHPPKRVIAMLTLVRSPSCARMSRLGGRGNKINDKACWACGFMRTKLEFSDNQWRHAGKNRCSDCVTSRLPPTDESRARAMESQREYDATMARAVSSPARPRHGRLRRKKRLRLRLSKLTSVAPCRRLKRATPSTRSGRKAPVTRATARWRAGSPALSVTTWRWQRPRQRRGPSATS